jgi:hypothetical protein
MGSDNDKTFGQLPKKRRKGRKDRSTLMIVGVCFGTVFLAGLFVAVLHVLNHPSHSSTKEGFKQLTDSAPVRPQASGTHRSLVEGDAGTMERAAAEEKAAHEDLSQSDADEEAEKARAKARMKAKMAGFKRGEVHPNMPSRTVEEKYHKPAKNAAARDLSKVDRQYSLPLYGDNFIEVGTVGFGDNKEGSGTVSGWFYLDPKNKAARMKTLFANRNAGCDKSANRYGYAVYVNGWKTSDLAVHADIGNDEKGCYHMQSSPKMLQYGKWTHVALTIFTPHPDAETAFTIYVDFKKVATVKVARGSTRSVHKLRIGAHIDGEAGFIGNVSEVTVWEKTMVQVPEDTLSPEVRGDTAIDAETADLVGYYRLDIRKPYNKNSFTKVMDTSGNEMHGFATRSNRRLLGHPVNIKADSKFTSEVATAMGWDAVALAAGLYADNVPRDVMESLALKAKDRATAVKAAMQHCWKHYRAKAWGMDEIHPVSGRGQNNWGGMGMTLLDSLDTLWVMGMRDEFYDAKDWVASSLSFDRNRMVSTFETTIRALGGLLSAYDLSEEKIFLQKAEDLGARLFKAFSTPSGMPNGQVNLATGSSQNAGWTGSAAILAEVGTLQLEFRYLGKVANKPAYVDVSTKVFKTLKEKNRMANGLAPIYVSPGTGRFTTNRVTFGALGDSYYEYLLKTWLQGGKKEAYIREMYDNAMDGVAKLLYKRSSPSNLAYVGDWDGSRITHKMDHLACFLPGLLALGAYTDPSNKNAKRDMTMARSMLYTCYQTYRRTATGIAAEYSEFPNGQDPRPASRAPFYILRPETAESMFILHQITGNPIYQEWAWDIFSAITKYSKTAFGYGSYPDVRQQNRRPDDRMESFWLGETLKYLYMVQAPMEEHKIDLTKYVFNTECHPTRIFPLLERGIQPQDIRPRN